MSQLFFTASYPPRGRGERRRKAPAFRPGMKSTAKG